MQLIACSLWLSSCQTIDLYERVVSIPSQEWKSSFKPQFNFTIKDTQSHYNIYIILRHNEKYEFNNLWVSLTYQLKGEPPVVGQYELPLANNERWLGTAMDDLYEHWVQVAKDVPLKAGEYGFTIGQIMRKDPLENVLNIGLRIEKTQ
ncbi:MAG TPA: gliding motility lipoprotein GldH [Flavisolibacter sp.]|nr:gliding motility lipoprotein GldH [Flavisolibacter sp.]